MYGSTRVACFDSSTRQALIPRSLLTILPSYMVFRFRFGDTGFSCDDIVPGDKSANLTGKLTGETQVAEFKRKAEDYKAHI